MLLAGHLLLELKAPPPLNRNQGIVSRSQDGDGKEAKVRAKFGLTPENR